jgi:hypothetical protein
MKSTVTPCSLEEFYWRYSLSGIYSSGIWFKFWPWYLTFWIRLTVISFTFSGDIVESLMFPFSGFRLILTLLLSLKKIAASYCLCDVGLFTQNKREVTDNVYFIPVCHPESFKSQCILLTIFQNGIHLICFYDFNISPASYMNLNFSLHSCCRFIGDVIAEHYFCAGYVIPYGLFIPKLEKMQGEKYNLLRHHQLQSHQVVYIIS